MTIKMTEAQFRALRWELVSVEDDGHNLDGFNMELGYDESGELEWDTRYNSWVGGGATLRAVEQPELTLSFNWQASTKAPCTYQEAFDFEVGVDENQPGIELHGAELVDEDGDELLGTEISCCLTDAIDSVCWTDAAAELLPTPDVEDIDEDTDMSNDEKITVQRDNGPDLRFSGECVGRASSSDERARGDFSGSTGRWTSLRLYRTRGGKYVCEQIGHTRWQGEHDRHSGAVCETEAEVIAFFGHGWLAKELYEDAGIDACEDVE